MTEPLPTNATGWLALAERRRQQGDGDGVLEAIDRALALEPRNIRAFMAKGDYLTESGKPRAAAAFYAGIARAPLNAVHPDFHGDIARAKAALDRYAIEFEAHIRGELENRGISAQRNPPRFQRAVDVLVGKKQIYPQQPKHIFFPELAPIQFFERRDFTFLDQFEDAYRDIRAELLAILENNDNFEPYVQQRPDRPPSDQAGMAGNKAWSACFMIKDGENTAFAARCPTAMAALAGAPQPRIRKHSPFALFSRLTPGAHIPPHSGMINTRLICHLALVAPPNCYLRVGNETRSWEEGKAWVFDDTIEHEAWNASDADRTVMIFDIWRPDLSIEEREAFGTLCEIVEDYEGSQEWD